MCAYKSFHSTPCLFLEYCRHNCLYEPCAWKEKHRIAEEVSIVNLWCQPSSPSPTLLICSTTVLQWNMRYPCLHFNRNTPFFKTIIWGLSAKNVDSYYFVYNFTWTFWCSYIFCKLILIHHDFWTKSDHFICTDDIHTRRGNNISMFVTEMLWY